MQGKLTVERLRTDGGWPKLKAKAAAIRHLAPFALELAKEHNNGSLHDRRRVALAQRLAECYVIFQSEHMFCYQKLPGRNSPTWGSTCACVIATLRLKPQLQVLGLGNSARNTIRFSNCASGKLSSAETQGFTGCTLTRIWWVG